MGLVYILLVPQIWMATSQNGWCAISSTPRSPFGSNSTKRQLEQCFGSNSGTASNRGKEIQLRILSKYSQNKEIHMGPTSFRAHFPKFTGRPETGARLERIAFWIWKNHLMRSPTYCTRPGWSMEGDPMAQRMGGMTWHHQLEVCCMPFGTERQLIVHHEFAVFYTSPQRCANVNLPWFCGSDHPTFGASNVNCLSI